MFHFSLVCLPTWMYTTEWKQLMCSGCVDRLNSSFEDLDVITRLFLILFCFSRSDVCACCILKQTCLICLYNFIKPLLSQHFCDSAIVNQQSNINTYNRTRFFVVAYCNYCTLKITLHKKHYFKILMNWAPLLGVRGRNAWLILKMPLECTSLVSIQFYIKELKKKKRQHGFPSCNIALDMINILMNVILYVLLLHINQWCCSHIDNNYCNYIVLVEISARGYKRHMIAQSKAIVTQFGVYFRLCSNNLIWNRKVEEFRG